MEVKNWFWHSGLFRVNWIKWAHARMRCVCGSGIGIRRFWNARMLFCISVESTDESRAGRFRNKTSYCILDACEQKKRQNRPFLHVEVVKESKTMKIRSICVSIEFKLFSSCQASIYWRICKLVQFWSQSEFLLVTYN